MTSAQRKYESGAQKRKCQQQKQERALELLKKTPKLTSFFQSQPAAATASTSRPTTTDVDHEDEPGTPLANISGEEADHVTLTDSEGATATVVEEKEISLDAACWGKITE